MAKFQTHLEVATVLSGMASSLLLSIGVLEPGQALMLVCFGAFGGILPDIDVDDATSVRLVFKLLSFILALLVFGTLLIYVSIPVAWLICAAIFAVMHWIIRPVFESLTVHRGCLHSLLACIFYLFVVVNMAYHVFSVSPYMSWWMGLFVFLGALIHLVLDEIYSVDFSNQRIKRSFGSAIKVLDRRYWRASLLLFALTVMNYLVTPSALTLKKTLEQIVWLRPVLHWADAGLTSFAMGAIG